MFDLRFSAKELRTWAARYDAATPGVDDTPEKAGHFMQEKGYLDQDHFMEIGCWKSPRPKPHYKKNDPAFVREVTGVALSTDSERLRIEVLTLLDGVSWPTASVILHFGHEGKYSILDYRAFWSLSAEEPSSYNFGIWWEYVLFCRTAARKHNLKIRELDRALWQYAKEHQPSGSK